MSVRELKTLLVLSSGRTLTVSSHVTMWLPFGKPICTKQGRQYPQHTFSRREKKYLNPVHANKRYSPIIIHSCIVTLFCCPTPMPAALTTPPETPAASEATQPLQGPGAPAASHNLQSPFIHINRVFESGHSSCNASTQEAADKTNKTNKAQETSRIGGGGQPATGDNGPPADRSHPSASGFNMADHSIRAPRDIPFSVTLPPIRNTPTANPGHREPLPPLHVAMSELIKKDELRFLNSYPSRFCDRHGYHCPRRSV